MRSLMNRKLRATVIVCGLAICLPQSSFAQGSSLFSGSGLTKSGTGGISGNLGGTGFGSLTGGTGGSSALGALGANRGTQGMNGTGLGALGATGANGLTGMNAANMGFVGRTNTGMAGNARAGQGTGNNGNANRSFNQFNNTSAFNQNQSNLANSQKRSSSIRPRQKVAFDYNTKTPAKVVGNITTRLDRIAIKKPELKQVNVQVVGEQLVLTGHVRTAEQARLAENLLRLEPGVKSIRNELKVEQVTSE